MAEENKKSSIILNAFTEQSVKEFKTEFDELNNSNIPMIPIFIDSFGGEIYSLFAILDIISTATKPIATIALGKAMSCGSILLACGSPGFRFVGPYSTVMIHDAASISFGKIEELKADVFEADRLNTKLYSILDEKCGKKKSYFHRLVGERKHANMYLNPQEVITHGLADHIGIPVIDLTFNLNVISPLKSENEGRKNKSNKPKSLR
ncbi:MAG: ATP-dependent Clp protease proteolytic subunit [Bacteroidota bacterium]|jgi:ATP-dependent Clp protease protease subunit